MMPKNEGSGVLKRYVRWCHKRPLTVICCELIILLGLSLCVYLKTGFELSEDTKYDWYILGDTYTDREDALDAAVSMAMEGRNSTDKPRAQERTKSSITIMYKPADGISNLLNSASLQTMKLVEDIFTNHGNFEKYCKLHYIEDSNNISSHCADILSSMNYYYSSNCNSTICIGDGQGTIFPNTNNESQSVLPTEFSIDLTSRYLASDLYSNGFYFDKSFLVTSKQQKELEKTSVQSSKTSIRSSYIRSKVILGSDIEGLEFAADKEKATATATLNGYTLPTTNYLRDNLFKMKAPGTRLFGTKYQDKAILNNVEVLWFSWDLREHEFTGNPLKNEETF